MQQAAKVQQAAVWFVNNKRLYKEQGITLNQIGVRPQTVFHQMNTMKIILITLTIENVRYQIQLAVALLVKHNLMKMTGVKMKLKILVGLQILC